MPSENGTKEFDAQAVVSHSVQPPLDTNERAPADSAMLIMLAAAAADAMIPFGTMPKARDKELRQFFISESYLASAIASVAARNCVFKWKLYGPDASVSAAQEMLVNSHYGRGWEHMWSKLCIDFLTQDLGAYMQLIRLNNDDPRDPVINLTHLDAARCFPTGNPMEPVIYMDRKNKYHLLKWWQVKPIMELPAPIEHMQAGAYYELQYCAVTRVLRAAQILRNIAIYKDEKTAGRFQRAIHLIGGISSQEVNDALAQHRLNADQQGLLRYIQPLMVSTIDPNAQVSTATLELASMPDGFDEDKTMKNYIMALALGLLTDYQELAPLPGGGLGTSQQSETQHMKSRGKGAGLFKNIVTHLMNFGGILPQNVTFAFEEDDPEADKAKAEVKKVRADTRAVQIQSGELDEEAAIAIAVEDGDIPPEIVADLLSRLEERRAEKKAGEQARFELDRERFTGPTIGAVPNNAKPQNMVRGAEKDLDPIVGGLADMIASYAKDEYRVDLSSFLQTRIHRAFTLAADDLAALGYMDTDGRIALSGLIGDLLRQFSESMGYDDLAHIGSVLLSDDDVQQLIKSVAALKQIPKYRLETEARATGKVEAALADAFGMVRDRMEVLDGGSKSKKPAATMVEETRVLRRGDGRIDRTITTRRGE